MMKLKIESIYTKQHLYLSSFEATFHLIYIYFGIKELAQIQSLKVSPRIFTNWEKEAFSRRNVLL